MKVRVRDEPLVCDGCGKENRAVVDSPTKGGGPWGYFCQQCVGIHAVAHWRESTITTMLVREMSDTF